ncbi:hypothetical protein JCM5296_001319 [Sporobolomyces johnsonii]
MQTPEDLALQHGLIASDALAAQGGSLNEQQREHLNGFLTGLEAAQSNPTTSFPEAAALSARLDALAAANADLQARLAQQSASSAPSVSAPATIDWQAGLEFFRTASGHKGELPTLGSKIKVKEPETFDGARGSSKADVNNFVSQLQNYIADTTGWRDDAHKVRVSASYMRGSAYTWIASYLALSDLDKLKPEYDWLQDFGKFTKKVVSTYGDPDKDAADARRLNQLRQTGATSLYAAEFRHLSLCLNWGAEALKFHFIHGLKEEVKDELARIDDIGDFDTLVEKAITIDNCLFQRRLHRSATGKTTSSTFPLSATVRSSTSTSTTTTTDAPAEDRMQIDGNRKTTTRRGPLSQAEKDYRRKNDLFGFCGGAGHYASGCPILAARNSTNGKSVRTAAATIQIVSPHPAMTPTILDDSQSGNDQSPTDEEH